MKIFLKWAGGKTQLLDNLNAELNKLEKEDVDLKKMVYIEPFVGAGAFFIDNLDKDRFNKYIINDINYKLINLYIQIRDNVEELIENIKNINEHYIKLQEEEKKEYFYKSRSRFNDIRNSSEELLELAVLFIFLNKTCFNGLYRENSKGEFNVPFGNYKNPRFIDEDNVRRLSEALNKKDENGKYIVKILNKNYLDLENHIDKNSFVYLDPPYRPITKGGFNSYDRSDFNDNSQIELSRFIDKLTSKKAYILLSNSDPKNLDEKDSFFDDLYKDYNIDRVYARRSINSNGSGRGKISELLINNFNLV